MKRFRWWWILALLLLGGVVLALVLRPERGPVEVVIVSRTNDASGQPYVIIRVSNRSAEDLATFAASDKLVRTEWIPVIPESDELAPFAFIELPRGDTWHVKLPAPAEKVKWRVTVTTIRELSRLERFLEQCFEKLRLKYPDDSSNEEVLEFNE
jgi:hypothetical protein